MRTELEVSPAHRHAARARIRGAADSAVAADRALTMIATIRLAVADLLAVLVWVLAATGDERSYGEPDRAR